MRSASTLVGMIVAIVAIGVLTQSGPAHAGDGAILAVFDMEDRGAGLSPEGMTNLTDYLAVLMAEGGYQVVPRDQIKARLKAQAVESAKECYDQSCQVELGRELAAQKTLATQIFKIGSKCRVTGTMFDLKRAATEKAASTKAGCSEDELGEALEKIAKKLTGKRVDVAKAKAEADRRAREEADRKTKEEADRKTKEEADRKTKEEADSALRKTRRAAKDAEARDAAARKVAEEEALEKPSSFDIADTWWHAGLKFGLVSPNLTADTGIYIEQKRPMETRMVLDILSGPGFMLEGYADFKLGSYFSAGLFAGYATFESHSEYDGEQRGVVGGGTAEINERTWFGYFYLGPRLAGRVPVSRTVELRLAVGVGPGLTTNGAKHQPVTDDPPYEVEDGNYVDLEGGLGLAANLNLQVAWFLTDYLGLVFDFGVLGQAFGEPSSGEGDITVSAGPYLTFNLGVEFGG